MKADALLGGFCPLKDDTLLHLEKGDSRKRGQARLFLI